MVGVIELALQKSKLNSLLESKVEYLKISKDELKSIQSKIKASPNLEEDMSLFWELVRIGLVKCGGRRVFSGIVFSIPIDIYYQAFLKGISPDIDVDYSLIDCALNNGIDSITYKAIKVQEGLLTSLTKEDKKFKVDYLVQGEIEPEVDPDKRTSILTEVFGIREQAMDRDTFLSLYNDLTALERLEDSLETQADFTKFGEFAKAFRESLEIYKRLVVKDYRLNVILNSILNRVGNEIKLLPSYSNVGDTKEALHKTSIIVGDLKTVLESIKASGSR